jgi:hypothetical protein
VPHPKEPRSRSGRTFEEELEAYLDWLAPELAAAGLDWDDVVIQEDLLDQPSGSTKNLSAVAPEQFVARFSEILDVVARDWVNLTAFTLQDRRLVLVVEWFSQPWCEGLRPPGRPVSVNWSGNGFRRDCTPHQRLTGGRITTALDCDEGGPPRWDARH